MSTSREKIDGRRRAIVEELHREGKVYVNELSRSFAVTAVTIRHDLDVLEQEGKLVRMNGGAVCVGGEHIEPLDGRIKNVAEKETVARTVARMVKNGSTVFLNSGTTTLCIAQALKSARHLNIVTNSLDIATVLGNVPTFRVILLGGEINSNYRFTYGSDAQEQLARYQSDWAILSMDGVAQENGITTYHAEEAILDRMMMDRAVKTVIAADHTKIGKTGFTKVCDCSPKITLVTDPNADTTALATLTENGVTVICE